MTAHGYVPPSEASGAFTCPHCGVYSQQDYSHQVVKRFQGGVDQRFVIRECLRCQKATIWFESTAIYPPLRIGEPPGEDVPDDVRADYSEAREIGSRSPRGAAALLRLAIQKLCKHLGERGENINHDIGQLVDKGLSPQIQKALDVVRVVGNSAVHPGELDVRDNPEVVGTLFKLVNLIVSEMITRPKEVDAVYDTLPQGALDAIEKRDGNA